MRNSRAIFLFVICVSIQQMNGISIGNGINLIFPANNNVDAVKKCENVEDLEKNVVTLFVSLAESEAIPDWIENDILDNIEDEVASIPAESRAFFIDFLEALFDYKSNIDEIQTDLSLKVVKVVQSIKDDTVMKDLLSKVSAVGEDDENASKEVFEHCSSIGAAQESVGLFNGNSYQCINTFRFEIAPEIGKIVNQSLEITSKYNVDGAENATKTEDAITSIKKLTETIKSQNQISTTKRNELMSAFSNCLENSKNQCISNLSVVLSKANTN